jgi:hypothetical protein
MMLRKGSSILVLMLLLPLNGVLSLQQHETPPQDQYLPGELVLFLDVGARDRVELGERGGMAYLGLPSIDALNEKFLVYRAERVIRGRLSEGDKEYGMDLLYHLYLPEDADILSLVKEYKRSPFVYDAFPNYIFPFTDTPNDPQFNNQWALPKIKAPEGWSIQKGDSTVNIGIVDSAIDWDHPDLEDNLWINVSEDFNGNGQFDNFPSGSGGDLNGLDDDGNGFVDDVIGWDFTSWDRDPSPMTGGSDHGTWVAGISNMVTDNGTGGAGVAWNCRIMAFRCETSPGSGFISITSGINAINYASNNGGHVLNMSWGGYSFNTGLNNAIQNAHGIPNIVLCAASGNDNISSTHYPSGYANVIAVSATDQSDLKAGFSNYGSWVDVCAPGVGIFGTENGGTFSTSGGTSASSPIAAGAVALLVSQNPGWPNTQIENQLFNNCDNIDTLNPTYAGLLGYGRINLLNALGTSLFSNLSYVDVQIDDSSGDNDGRAEFGETIDVIVTLHNETGWQDAFGVSGTISTGETRINITNPTSSFGNIPNGTSGTNSADPFIFTVTDSFVHNVTFDITFDGAPNSINTDASFTLMIGHPFLLIVDDDGGGLYEGWYGEALDSLDVPFDEWDVNALGMPPGTGVYGLRDHEVVVWFTGNETATLTSAEIDSLMNFLDNGGNLFITGQNIGEDINSDPFYANYLHASFVSPAINDFFLSGVPGDPIGDGFTLLTTGAPGAGNQISQDVIAPLLDADSVIVYEAGSIAGIKYAGVYRVVYFGFGFEGISSRPAQGFDRSSDVMCRILDWFGYPCTVTGVEEETVIRNPGTGNRLLLIQPNPFYNRTEIRFSPQGRNSLTLKVFDLSGRLVKTLFNAQSQTTDYESPISITWDGSDDKGKEVVSGVYFLRLEAGSLKQTQKAILLR